MPDKSPFHESQKLIRCEVVNRYQESSVRFVEIGSFKLWEYLMTSKHALMVGDPRLCLWVVDEEYQANANVFDRAGDIEEVDRIVVELFDRENGFRVVDEGGREVDPGQVGEVIIRGAHVMKEYWNRPEATADTLRDGWLYSGDMATVDKDGFVYIQDRKKDMIISGGENVYPAEIEEVLSGHPGIADCAVIGIPSEKWGESPAAIVVPTPGDAPSGRRAGCRTKVRRSSRTCSVPCAQRKSLRRRSRPNCQFLNDHAHSGE